MYVEMDNPKNINKRYRELGNSYAKNNYIFNTQ